MSHPARRTPRRRLAPVALSALLLGGAGTAAVTLQQAADPAPAIAQTTADGLELLTDPFLQLPTADGVSVVWMTEWAGDDHRVVVGDREYAATTTKLSRVGEDSGSQLPTDERPAVEDGIVDRDVYRHEARIAGLRPGTRLPYHVVSSADGASVTSRTFELAPAAARGQPQRILLTSDHQAMVNTPANLEIAARTIGDIDAVFLAGDLVNIPDRASEWFDDQRGSGFFPVLQGRGGRASTHGEVYRGAEIIQSAPLFPAVGNHEVQGARAGHSGLNASFNAPVPRAVVEQAYEAVADTVNPSGDPAVKARWIEDRSFSTATYEEIFSLPDGSPGGETYYAVTIGDVRLISLYSTRIWRGTTANADPAARTGSSRYQEAASTLEDPLRQGWGEHIFEGVGAGSEQLRWLEQELASPEFRDARFRVVMLHEGPQGLGDNVMPVFTDPVRIEERGADGRVIGVRYEYPSTRNRLVHELQPLLEEAGVDLVHNGHSHLWNRFRAPSGTNFLETSNTGNSYGAYHHLSGRTRPLPPAPWLPSNYMSIGNPGGLAPIVPSENPMLAPNGEPMPFVQSNDHAVFTVLDTGANEVVSYVYDVRTPDVEPVVLDRFSLGRPVPEEPRQPERPVAPPTTPPSTPPTTPAPRAGPRASLVRASVRPTPYGVGARIAVRVNVGSAADGGSVDVATGGRGLATGRVRGGAATVQLQGTALKPGRHDLVVRFAGAAGVAPSQTRIALTVRKARPAIRATRVTRRVVAGRTRARLRLRVTAPGLAPRGTVVVREKGRRLAAGRVRAGRASVRLPRFTTAGAKRLQVAYRGTDTLHPRTVTLRLRVAQAR